MLVLTCRVRREATQPSHVENKHDVVLASDADQELHAPISSETSTDSLEAEARVQLGLTFQGNEPKL